MPAVPLSPFFGMTRQPMTPDVLAYLRAQWASLEALLPQPWFRWAQHASVGLGLPTENTPAVVRGRVSMLFDVDGEKLPVPDSRESEAAELVAQTLADARWAVPSLLAHVARLEAQVSQLSAASPPPAVAPSPADAMVERARARLATVRSQPPEAAVTYPMPEERVVLQAGAAESPPEERFSPVRPAGQLPPGMAVIPLETVCAVVDALLDEADDSHDGNACAALASVQQHLCLPRDFDGPPGGRAPVALESMLWEWEKSPGQERAWLRADGQWGFVGEDWRAAVDALALEVVRLDGELRRWQGLAQSPQVSHVAPLSPEAEAALNSQVESSRAARVAAELLLEQFLAHLVRVRQGITSGQPMPWVQQHLVALSNGLARRDARLAAACRQVARLLETSLQACGAETPESHVLVGGVWGPASDSAPGVTREDVRTFLNAQPPEA